MKHLHIRLHPAGIALLFMLTLLSCRDGKTSKSPSEPATVVSVPTFIADSAYRYVALQCAFGPRVPGTDAHRACGDWLAQQLRLRGADVIEQEATVKAWNGDELPMRNIIGQFNTHTNKRVILCAHWDTRPWADNDPAKANHYIPISGANDGASGVGVLLEMARQFSEQLPAIGVDIIFFDAEDYGIHADSETPHVDDTWCLGSRYWARHPHKQDYIARYGILLDMVGTPDARFCQENISKNYAPGIVEKVWRTAHSMGLGSYFPFTEGSWVTDDHLPINQTAKIPCIDIIPYDEKWGFGEMWHTLGDDITWIDAKTLGIVGGVLMQVVYNEK